MEILDWSGKKVFVILKNKREYSGFIQNIYFESSYYFTLIGKFGEMVTFPLDEVKVIQEEKVT